LVCEYRGYLFAAFLASSSFSDLVLLPRVVPLLVLLPRFKDAGKEPLCRLRQEFLSRVIHRMMQVVHDAGVHPH